MAVQNEHERRTKLRLVDVSEGTEVELQGELGSASFTTWLPDGSGILFVGDTRTSWTSTGPQVWLQPIKGGAPRRITADTSEYRNVSVTRDGHSLVAVGTDRQASLWRVSGTGEGQASKVPSMRGDGIGGMAWLGTRLLFTGFESGEPQLWTMAPDGSDRRQLTTEGWGAWPSVSADGKTIYFISARGDRLGIWRMDAGGGNARELVRVWYAGPMRLTPDGKWLYYTVRAAGRESTWRVPVEGGEPTLVVEGLGWAIAPNGRMLAGLWRLSAQSAYSMAVFSIDGGDPIHRFPGFTPGGGEKLHWTVDGKALLLTTSERMNIWRQELGGGPLARVTNFVDAAIFGFVPSADGSLVLTRGESLRDAFLVTGFR